MKRKITQLLKFLTLTLLVSESVFAEHGFQPAVIKDGLIDKYNTYPPSERNMARTGRVSVSFMIDTKGLPFEVMVEQANNPKFIKPTIKSVLAGKYEPATFNGVPVVSHQRTVERFNIGYDSRSPWVSTKKMNKHLNNFNAEMKKKLPNQKALSKYLKRMAGTKHGSQLGQKFLSYNRYLYAREFGDESDQIYAAREVLLSSNEGRLVRAYPQVRINLVGLLLNAGRLGEARVEYSEAVRALRGDSRSTLLNSYADKINQIENMVSSDQAFSRNVKIGKRGYTYLPLMKSGFSIKDVNGKIEMIKLRCKKKFTKLAFKVTGEYTIPKTWGACQLQLIGDQGTTANLMQS